MTISGKSSGVLGIACALAVVALTLLYVPQARALPGGGQVAEGAAAIHQPNASSLRIDQMSDRALLNWQGFSIGQGETVQFVQPSATALVVNKVLGGDPSIILGQLLANGRVFLLNPNGVLFGPNATVNVGGLMATTLSLKSYDLTTGRFELAQDPTKALAAVVNQGTLRVADHGFVVLAAPGVGNDGLIVAKFGQVGLGAGTQMTVDFRGDGLIQYAVEGKVLDQVTDPSGKSLTNAISNTGRIEADGGTVLLTAQASSAVVSSVINHSGVIQARRLENQGGEIVLRGGDEGAVMVAGTLNARAAAGEKGENSSTGSGRTEGHSETGGTIDVRGQQVGLTETARLDVSGDTGGGTITVGGGFQGKDGGPNAQQSVVWPGATLLADAKVQGDGGTVIVWADGTTQFGGMISARGGSQGGNGGFAEVSGRDSLVFRGTVDLRAPLGQSGTLLLDPKFIIISPTGADYTPPYGFANNASSSVTILDTGPNSLSEALDLASVTLEANTDITFEGNAVPANAAHVTGTTSGNGLTLQAGRSIIFEQNSALTLNNALFTAVVNDDFAVIADRNGGTAQFVMNSGAQLNIEGQVNIAVGSFGGSFLGEVRIGNGNGPATIDAGAGAIFITGYGDPGILVDSGSTLTANLIQLSGTGGPTGGVGVRLVGPGTQLLAEAQISIGGSGVGIGAGNAGIELIDGVVVATTQDFGSIVLNGDGADTAPGIRTTSSGANNSIGQASADIVLNAETASGADSIELANLTIQNFNDLTLEPLSPSVSIGIAGGAGVFNLSAADLDSIQQGLNDIFIGQFNGTHTVTVGEGAGPTGYNFGNSNVQIQAGGVGGTITVDGPLAATNGLALVAGTQITVSPTGSLAAGTLSLISEALALNGSPGSISATGRLFLQPFNSTTSIGIGDGAAGAFVVDSAMLTLIETDVTDLTIGHIDGQHVITIEAVTFQSRGVTIRSPFLGGGGSITVNGPVLAPGSLSLLADAQITIASTGSLTTTGVLAALTLRADVVALNGMADSISGIGTLTLQPNSPTTSIGLGDGAAGTFHLSNTELLTLKDDFILIQIQTSSGAIAIETVTFRDPVLIQSPSPGGTITVNGALATTGADSLSLVADAQITVNAAASVRTVTGALSFTADALALNGAADSISGAGTLLLQPSQVLPSIGIGDGAAGTFNLTNTELLTLKDGFSGITIGNAHGGHAIDIRTVTFHDPVTIRTPAGGSIHVNGTLTGGAGVPITLIGSGATTTLNADIVTAGEPITIDDSVIVAGGTDTTRTLDTTNGGTAPAGADITVTGTINAGTSSPNNESLTVTGGTTGDVALGSGDLVIPTYDQPIGGTQPLRNLTATGDVMNFPQATLTGALSATGATANFNGQVVVGADGIITMVYSEGMFLFADMLSPNAVLTAIGPVTLMHDVVLDVGLGTLTMQNTVNTQSFNFTLRGNGIDLLGGGGSIIGTGTNVLELAPGTPDTSLGIADGAGTLQLNAAELTPIGTGVNGFATVRLGRADSTATITLGTYTAPYAVTIQADAPGGEGAIHVTGAFATGPAGESLTLLASKNIVVNPGASLTTNNGPIMLSSNAAGTATGNFVGIDVNGATLNSGSGPLTLLGKGGTTGNDNIGVRLTNNAQMQGGSGLVTLIGVGGNGGTGQQNVGVSLQGGSQVTTTTGGIQVTGTGGTNALDQGGLPTGQFNRGVQLITGAQVLSTGSGPITMVGQGGASGTIDHGLAINSRIASAGGAIDLTGNAGGTPTGMNNHGLILANGAQVEGTGPAAIHLKGTGGQGIASDSVHGEAGVYIIGTNGTFVRTQAGALTLEGTGGGTSFGGYGVIVRFGAVVESTGGGAVLVKGTGSPTGTAFNHGVIVYEAGTTIRATGTAALTLAPGQGGGTWYNNYGVMVGNGALVEHLGTGQITITGTGGGNGDNEPSNFGVLLLGATTQIKALQGEIVITGTGAGTPPATGVFQVNSPVIQDQNTPTIISNP